MAVSSSGIVMIGMVERVGKAVGRAVGGTVGSVVGSEVGVSAASFRQLVHIGRHPAGSHRTSPPKFTIPDALPFASLDTKFECDRSTAPPISINTAPPIV